MSILLFKIIELFFNILLNFFSIDVIIHLKAVLIMKKYNTSYRLKQIMSERNLKQVDILRLAEPYCKKYGAKLNKNDLSQYVSGKVEPGQTKLYILGLALGVNEAWLMGFDDVQMNKNAVNLHKDKIKTDILQLTEHEQTVITAYRNKPEMQPAVDKLLGVNEDTELIPSLVAARSKNNDEPIHFENLPDLSKFPVDDTEL